MFFYNNPYLMLAKLGGSLPIFQGDEGSSEVDLTDSDGNGVPDNAVIENGIAMWTDANGVSQTAVVDMEGNWNTLGKDDNQSGVDPATGLSFSQAFSSAKSAGEKTFTWNGKVYTTRSEGESEEEFNAKFDSEEETEDTDVTDITEEAEDEDDANQKIDAFNNKFRNPDQATILSGLGDNPFLELADAIGRGVKSFKGENYYDPGTKSDYMKFTVRNPTGEDLYYDKEDYFRMGYNPGKYLKDEEQVQEEEMMNFLEARRQNRPDMYGKVKDFDMDLFNLTGRGETFGRKGPGQGDLLEQKYSDAEYLGYTQRPDGSSVPYDYLVTGPGNVQLDGVDGIFVDKDFDKGSRPTGVDDSPEWQRSMKNPMNQPVQIPSRSVQPIPTNIPQPQLNPVPVPVITPTNSEMDYEPGQEDLPPMPNDLARYGGSLPYYQNRGEVEMIDVPGIKGVTIEDLYNPNTNKFVTTRETFRDRPTINDYNQSMRNRQVVLEEGSAGTPGAGWMFFPGGVTAGAAQTFINNNRTALENDPVSVGFSLTRPPGFARTITPMLSDSTIVYNTAYGTPGIALDAYEYTDAVAATPDVTGNVYDVFTTNAVPIAPPLYDGPMPKMKRPTVDMVRAENDLLSESFDPEANYFRVHDKDGALVDAGKIRMDRDWWYPLKYFHDNPDRDKTLNSGVFRRVNVDAEKDHEIVFYGMGLGTKYGYRHDNTNVRDTKSYSDFVESLPDVTPGYKAYKAKLDAAYDEAEKQGDTSKKMGGSLTKYQSLGEFGAPTQGTLQPTFSGYSLSGNQSTPFFTSGPTLNNPAGFLNQNVLFSQSTDDTYTPMSNARLYAMNQSVNRSLDEFQAFTADMNKRLENPSLMMNQVNTNPLQTPNVSFEPSEEFLQAKDMMDYTIAEGQGRVTSDGQVLMSSEQMQDVVDETSANLQSQVDSMPEYTGTQENLDRYDRSMELGFDGDLAAMDAYDAAEAEEAQMRSDRADLIDASSERPGFGTRAYNTMLRVADSKPVQTYTKVSDMLIDVAKPVTRIARQFNENRQRANIMNNAFLADNMFAATDADITGNKGNYDPNSGIFRPDDKVVVGTTQSAQFGGGFYKPGGEIEIDMNTYKQLVAAGAEIQIV